MAKISIFMPCTLLILSYILFITTVVAALKVEKSRTFSADISTAPLPPSEDPFYTAPPGYKHAAPGEILRVRSALGLTKVVPNCMAAYNILYRTTDSNYKPAWAVTTLLVPQTNSLNSTTNKTTVAPGSTLLSYQVSYDSAYVNDSPSYTLYDVSTIDPGILTVLGQGWYVNLPDYEGPLASFTAGVQSGHATIDSIRAVLNSGFGVASNVTKYALWGYSGGALASEWAAELQAQYAPEMNFAGVALGGLTPNVTSTFESINGGPFAATAVNGFLGISSQDRAVERYLTKQLKTSGPYNATAFLAARHQNTTVDSVVYADQNIFDYFVSGASILQNPLLQSLINRDGMMGYHGVPMMPVFAYKAIGDEFSMVADTDTLIEHYCAVGANILYQRNTVGGHLAEFSNGHEQALAFLSAVLDGSYPTKYRSMGCTIQNVTVAIDSSPF